MTYKFIQYEQYDNYAVLSLNNPDQLNAMSPEMLVDLLHFFEQIPPRNIRFLIINGKGRCFGAGGDLKSMFKMDRAGAAEISKLSHKAFALIKTYPIPVVAVVHGYALGGGFELALACDLIFAMPDVWFALPELKFNMLPGGGGTVRLPQVIGFQQAFWNILTSSKITAHDALNKGIVQHILTTDNPTNEAATLLSQITLNIEYEAILALKKVMQYAVPYNYEAYNMESERFAYLLDNYAKQTIDKFINKEN